jgi:hypothetical protein
VSAFSITDWTAQQWTAFTGLVVAGLAALGLLAIMLQHLRARRAEADEVRRLLDSWRATPSTIVAILTGPTQPLPLGAGPRPLPLPVVDPTGEILAHVAPGPGSITSIREAGEGSLVRVEPADLVDPEVSTLFDGMMAKWQRSVDAALAPAMLTAVLWTIEGAMAGVVGRVALDEWLAEVAGDDADAWRAGTPTGEWPLVRVDPAEFMVRSFMDSALKALQ